MIARVLAGVLVSASCVAAQAFEVTSVKLSPPDQPGMGMSTERNGIRLNNATLKFCIEAAYKLQDYQLSGGPKWLDSDHYEIVGKASAPACYADLIKMLQTLLADRFQLQFHRETRMAPGWALTVAKAGPKLTEPATDGEPGLGMVNGRNQTMSGLAEALARVLGRPVADETGVTDKFDFRLTWTPSDSEPVMQKPGVGPVAATVDSTGPSVFAAIQEQLGLKLESRRVPVEVMVIDRAEKPAEN